jgi:Flp pilus assembly protein TadD
MIECTYPKLVTDEQLKESNWKPWNDNGYILSDLRSFYGFEFNIPSSLKLFEESE